MLTQCTLFVLHMMAKTMLSQTHVVPPLGGKGERLGVLGSAECDSAPSPSKTRPSHSGSEVRGGGGGGGGGLLNRIFDNCKRSQKLWSQPLDLPVLEVACIILAITVISSPAYAT